MDLRSEWNLISTAYGSALYGLMKEEQWKPWRERERVLLLRATVNIFFVGFHADFVSPLSFHWFVTFGSARNEFSLSLHCAGGNEACFFYKKSFPDAAQ